MPKIKVFMGSEWPEVLSRLHPMTWVTYRLNEVMGGTNQAQAKAITGLDPNIVAWVKYDPADIVREFTEVEEPAASPTAPANTAVLILAAAATHIADRADTYDKGSDRSMAAAVAAYNAIHGAAMTEAQGWHLLQLLKDVRLFTAPGYHADSAEDCLGYAALKAEALANAGAAQ